MRLDKYLKVSRLIKRRTVANEACDAGRVSAVCTARRIHQYHYYQVLVFCIGDGGICSVQTDTVA